jgi:serine/threonine protein kinase
VVAVYDLVTEGDEQWLVMEYVAGTTLTALVQREGGLAPDRAAPILRQAADALAAAHAAGIVHRDVKPSNMLVSPDGQVKLSDFGIARAEADASLTQTGLVTGSPAYLSPEVASGQQATPASDVWSLGATLYFTLAGQPPYDVGDNVLGALYRIVHEDPPRLADAGWLGPLLEATMTTDPAQRWPMARVRDYLDGLPADQTRTLVAPVPPPPPPPTEPPPTEPPPIEPAPTELAPEPVPPRTHRRTSGAPVAVLAAVAAIVVLTVVAWIAGSTGGDDEPRGTGGSRTPPTSSAPSTPSSSAPADVTADGMENFVETYLGTVTSDPKSAWAMLTPGFQAASGNFGQYQKFWGQFQSADLLTAQADPESKQISYTVEYLHRDGSKTRDDVTLTLEGTDGDFRIAAES